tara:strand:+ start:390 stop:1037 length:648 start_codon:yes stop_codon:yes gene_type:complete
MAKTKAHTAYRLKDGRRVKGVTTILNNLGWNKNVLVAWARRTALAGDDPDAVLKEAGTIGTLAHYLCESHIKGEEPDVADYSAEQIEKAENAFLGYLEWEKMTKPKYEAIELKMVSEKYEVGGTADFIARINGSLVLGDFKTSKGIYPEMTCQLAAYRKMYLELQPKAKIGSAMILKLDKNSGAFSHHFVSKQQLDWGWNVFKCCMELEKLKKDA